MKLVCVAFGTKHDQGIRDMIDDYSLRLQKFTQFDWHIIPAGASVVDEEKTLLKYLDEGDFLVLLDERGKEVTSPEIAEKLNTWNVAGHKKVVCVIGGAFGVSEVVRTRANFIWSLSKLVFPHQLVRLILAEQLYRGFSILAGTKYHHE